MSRRTPLDNDTLNEALASLQGWQLDGDRIVREFSFDDFKTAVSFIVRVGFEAEAMNHHPELTNVYNRVSIALTTHDAGNKVTMMDVELARSIDAISF